MWKLQANLHLYFIVWYATRYSKINISQLFQLELFHFISIFKCLLEQRLELLISSSKINAFQNKWLLNTAVGFGQASKLPKMEQNQQEMLRESHSLFTFQCAGKVKNTHLILICYQSKKSK